MEVTPEDRARWWRKRYLLFAAYFLGAMAALHWGYFCSKAPFMEYAAYTGAVLCCYGAFSRAARRVLWRIVWVALPVGLLGYGAVHEILPLLSGGGGRVQQGLMTGAVVVAGWIVTFAIQELRSEERRLAREIEIMSALAAEIIDALNDRITDDEAQKGADILAKIEAGQGQAPYFPFVPTPKQMDVFNKLSTELPILPARLSFHLVTYFTQSADLVNFAKDLQNDAWRELSPQQRSDTYRDFLSARKRADRLGVVALRAINREMPPWGGIDKPTIDQIAAAIIDEDNALPHAPEEGQ